VSRAGGLVLVQPEKGGEVAGREVGAVTARGCHQDAADWQAADSSQVGPDGLHLARGAEHKDVLVLVAAEPDRALKAESRHDSAGDVCLLDRNRGEADPDQVILAPCAERTREGLENDRIGRVCQAGLIQDVRGSKGGVPAQRQFAGRGEPSQPLFVQEGGGGLVQLSGGPPHPLAVGSLRQQAHHRRVCRRTAGR
jgi:hypothetical protein